MQILANIDESLYRRIQDDIYDTYDLALALKLIRNGKPLPQNHGFIALCECEEPLTKEARNSLKDTTFLGSNDCPYCFDITEIIEVDE